MTTTIGQSMKNIRKQKKIKSRELERMTGISHTTISRYENDYLVPGIFNLITIVDSLEISLDEYIGRDFSIEKRGMEYEEVY